jgi:hypothetical protein
MVCSQSNTSFVGDGVNVVSWFPTLNATSPIAIANSRNAPIPNAIIEQKLATPKQYTPDRFGCGSFRDTLVENRSPLIDHPHRGLPEKICTQSISAFGCDASAIESDRATSLRREVDELRARHVAEELVARTVAI